MAKLKTQQILELAEEGPLQNFDVQFELNIPKNEAAALLGYLARKGKLVVTMSTPSSYAGGRTRVKQYSLPTETELMKSVR